MAKFREDPIEESESEASSSETDAEPEPVKKAPAAEPKTVKKAANSSSSSSESEPESDLPPVNSKPLPETQPSSSSAPAKAGRKREATEGAKKKLLIERLFSKSDVIVMLEELVKRYPSPNMDDLYESVKGKLSVSVTKVQVLDKMKKLRIKFFNKKAKSSYTKKKKKKEGSSNVEEEEKEMVINQLSQKIWGTEEEAKSEGPKCAVIMGPTTRVDEWVFGEGSSLLAPEARSELERGWKKIRKDEVRVSIDKLELSLKHARMVYEAMNP